MWDHFKLTEEAVMLRDDQRWMDILADTKSNKTDEKGHCLLFSFDTNVVFEGYILSLTS